MEKDLLEDATALLMLSTSVVIPPQAQQMPQVSPPIAQITQIPQLPPQPSQTPIQRHTEITDLPDPRIFTKTPNPPLTSTRKLPTTVTPFEIFPEDAGIIRCICGVDDDDGFTVQCEKCYRWEHAVCVGIRSVRDAPEVYLCEQCNPRALDSETARRKQLDRKRLQSQARAQQSSQQGQERRRKRRNPSDAINNNNNTNNNLNSNSNNNNNNSNNVENNKKVSIDENARFYAEYCNDDTLSKNYKFPPLSTLFLNPIEKPSQENPIPLKIKQLHTTQPRKQQAKYAGKPNIILHSPTEIQEDQFITIYSGQISFLDEYISNKINQYDLIHCLKPHVTSIPTNQSLDNPNVTGKFLVIDARIHGSISRFITSSISPNCVIRPIKTSSNDLKNNIQFGVFATRYISPLEPLTLKWQFHPNNPIWLFLTTNIDDTIGSWDNIIKRLPIKVQVKLLETLTEILQWNWNWYIDSESKAKFEAITKFITKSVKKFQKTAGTINNSNNNSKKNSSSETNNDTNSTINWIIARKDGFKRKQKPIEEIVHEDKYKFVKLEIPRQNSHDIYNNEDHDVIYNSNGKFNADDLNDNIINNNKIKNNDTITKYNLTDSENNSDLVSITNNQDLKTPIQKFRESLLKKYDNKRINNGSNTPPGYDLIEDANYNTNSEHEDDDNDNDNENENEIEIESEGLNMNENQDKDLNNDLPIPIDILPSMTRDPVYFDLKTTTPSSTVTFETSIIANPTSPLTPLQSHTPNTSSSILSHIPNVITKTTSTTSLVSASNSISLSRNSSIVSIASLNTQQGGGSTTPASGVNESTNGNVSGNNNSANGNGNAKMVKKLSFADYKKKQKT